MALEDSYAEALQRMVQAGKSPKAAVTALHQSLIKSGRIALLSRIARAFGRLSQREHARNVVTLSVAGKSAHAKSEVKVLLDAMGVNPEEVETKTDDTLIGGWRLEGRETLYDASFKKHLLSIYNRTTQS